MSDFGKKATSKFKGQYEEVKDRLGAIRARMYMLVSNAILDKLMGEYPGQSFDDVDSKSLPFHSRIALFQLTDNGTISNS
jgi:hypothetical protein